MSRPATTWRRLEDTIERLLPRQLIVKLDCGSEFAWSCEIKFIIQPNPGRVDTGVTLFKTGGASAEAVLRACLDTLDELVASEISVQQAMTELRQVTAEIKREIGMPDANDAEDRP